MKHGKEEATPYVVIDRCDQDGSNHQQPIRDWNEELPVEYLRSVDDFDLREIGEFHHLRKKLPALLEWDPPQIKGCNSLTWKVAVMMACEATMAARMAMIKAG